MLTVRESMALASRGAAPEARPCGSHALTPTPLPGGEGFRGRTHMASAGAGSMRTVTAPPPPGLLRRRAKTVPATGSSGRLVRSYTPPLGFFRLFLLPGARRNQGAARVGRGQRHAGVASPASSTRRHYGREETRPRRVGRGPEATSDTVSTQDRPLRTCLEGRTANSLLQSALPAVEPSESTPSGVLHLGHRRPTRLPQQAANAPRGRHTCRSDCQCSHSSAVPGRPGNCNFSALSFASGSQQAKLSSSILQ